MSNKKILLVFDLNCLLGYRQKTKILKEELKGISLDAVFKPHITIGEYSTYYRPNSEVLFYTLFSRKKNFFDVAIWANQTKEETEIQTEQFFRTLKHQMKFVIYTSNRKPIDQNSYDIQYDYNLLENRKINPSLYKKECELLIPKPISKDLSIIFNKHPQYNEKNTIVISNYANEDERYLGNSLEIPLYHPLICEATFHRDAHLYFLNEYLHFLNGFFADSTILDVREGLRQLNYNKLQQIRVGSINPNKYTLNPITDDIRF